VTGRLLLDTRVRIWALTDPARMSAQVRATLSDPENDVFFSAASIWEIAIKFALGRSDVRVPPAQIAAEAGRIGFTALAVDSDAAARVADLPPHHRDPFDRLLVAQAMFLPARLLTADPALARYTDLVTLVG
jgi:PIN domain nuclease of toxin-antitoxin system